MTDLRLVRWDQLLRTVMTFATSRRPQEEQTRLLEVVQRANPTRSQEIQAMTKTIAEAWIEQGQLLANRDTLRRLLALRFGPVSEALFQRIEQTSDPERLRMAIDQVVQIQSLDELDL